MVPVRYSVRHQEEGADSQLERLILSQENDFEYHPNQNECLFAKDKSTSEIQKILKSRSKYLDKSDISEVLISDLGEHGNFSLVRLASESRDKFGGNEQVIAALRRLSTSPRKREGYFKEMMMELKRESQINELMVTDATEEAREFIKKNNK